MSLEEVRSRLPQEMHLVLANCDALTLYALHPEHSRVTEYGEPFHGYAILGQAQIEGAQDRRKVIIALYQDMADDTAFPAMCFRPHHGVHVVHDSRVVDLVLCYECGNMRIYLGEEKRPLTWSICGPSQWLLDDLLKAPSST